MKVVIVLAAIVAVAWSQVDAPIPYSFNYISNTEDGGSGSHQESGDGAGKVTGSYSVADLEGHNRVVEYVADENGFRATIRTNEPGTANINPADVIVESSAPEAAGAPTYSLGVATAPRVAQPARPSRTRYVLVPVTD
ncbi:cuticle protein 10.9 [Parasteatoda tepidariorum]|nr:cuticle protein 10.9 [Parasteatoda tepidariorum]